MRCAGVVALYMVISAIARLAFSTTRHGRASHSRGGATLETACVTDLVQLCRLTPSTTTEVAFSNKHLYLGLEMDGKSGVQQRQRQRQRRRAQRGATKDWRQNT